MQNDLITWHGLAVLGEAVLLILAVVALCWLLVWIFDR